MNTALLADYDKSLNPNREFVPVPQDGFYDPYDTETRQSERFQPLRTIALVSFYTAALTVYIVIFLCIILFGQDNNTAVILAASFHVLLLVIAGVMEGVIRLQHRRRQSLGYLEFYRQTKKLLPIPFQTAAYSVAALFLLKSLSEHSSYNIPEEECMIVVCVLEGMVIVIYDFFYIRRVLQHNQKETLPDASKYLQTPLTDIPDTRRRRRDVVFDNQVEIIRYLRRQTKRLHEEIMKLRETSVTSGGAGELDVQVSIDDQKSLIATGEQRIRALKAEVETLKSENEMARERFADLVQDAQKFQLLFDLQRKENQRLRGTLEEWSRRNAKLEARLNKTMAAAAATVNTPTTSTTSNLRLPKLDEPSSSSHQGNNSVRP
eukprot:g5263.t1